MKPVGIALVCGLILGVVAFAAGAGFTQHDGTPGGAHDLVGQTCVVYLDVELPSAQIPGKFGFTSNGKVQRFYAGHNDAQLPVRAFGRVVSVGDEWLVLESAAGGHTGSVWIPRSRVRVIDVMDAQEWELTFDVGARMEIERRVEEGDRSPD